MAFYVRQHSEQMSRFITNCFHVVHQLDAHTHTPTDDTIAIDNMQHLAFHLKMLQTEMLYKSTINKYCLLLDSLDWHPNNGLLACGSSDFKSRSANI